MELIKWLYSGGGKLIGFDENGERMYSVSNGESLAFCLIVGAAVTVFVRLAWLLLEAVR